MYPRPIQKLTEAFTRFPTIGPRTAARFVFYMLKTSDTEIDELIEALQNLKKEIHLCAFCFNPFEITDKGTKLCPVCSDSQRDQSLLCIIEKESDLEALEATNEYHGLYFILGDAINALKKDEIKNLRKSELKERLQDPEKFGRAKTSFKEVIIATNPTTEGEAAALYIERLLQQLQIKTTRLGRGLPIGGELEYADEETLRSALQGRK